MPSDIIFIVAYCKFPAPANWTLLLKFVLTDPVEIDELIIQGFNKVPAIPFTIIIA